MVSLKVWVAKYMKVFDIIKLFKLINQIMKEAQCMSHNWSHRRKNEENRKDFQVTALMTRELIQSSNQQSV